MKILKSLLLVSFLIMCTLPSFAQLGFKVGGNFATISGEDAAEGLHVGPLAGIYWKIGPNMVYLEPGVYYSGKGYKFKFLGTTVSTGLGYIELPILLNVKLPVGLGFYAGPGVGYLVNITLEGESISVDDTEFDVLDISAMGGIKWHLPAGLNFGVGFFKGFLELTPNSSVTNFGIQAFAGFTLPGGK